MRVSFAGGGSDYRSFAEHHGGEVISVALGWRVHVIVHPLSSLAPEVFRCAYSQVESCSSIHEIQHPTIRGALEALDWRRPVGIYTWSDIPARTGLGGSSAFIVALLAALHRLRGSRADSSTLARLAVEIERDRAGEPGGEQDQYAATFGGFRRYIFSGESSVTRELMPRRYLSALNDELLLVSSGGAALARVVTSTESHTDSNGDQDRMFQRDIAKDLAGQIHRSSWLRRPSLEPIAEAMRLSQRRKVLLWASPTEFDAMLDRIRASGAIGEKVCGAGGGGLIAAVVPRRKQEDFVAQMLSSGYRVYRPGVSRYGVKVSRGLNQQNAWFSRSDSARTSHAAVQNWGTGL